MGRKRKAEPKSRYRCGQCALARWLEDNRTLEGELFMLKCPHYKGGMVYHFATDVACERFEQRDSVTTLE
jgi:hypothetical protein